MVSRVVLLTGAARGLGKAMALALLGDGHRVILSATDRAALNDVISESGAGPDRAVAMPADLSAEGAAEKLADDASSVFGPIDALVNNAGIGPDRLTSDYLNRPFNFWDAHLALARTFYFVNALSPTLLAARLAPTMVERGWGRIVGNTTSLDTMLRMSLYGGSKAGQEAEIAAMAYNLAGTGVTANAIIPGGATASRMTDNVGLPREDVFPASIMAGPIRFLISDASNGFSGRRMLAIRWKDDLPVDEAAAKASDAIAWTGFGAQGVHPKSTATMFRRD
ncbi:MAG: SDR family oxidoreductase [Rhodobiaceae bacterium]|nr:SDR family oxidoreductase [Rhodobiaceae bacterium]MCC0056545.1 SDR family oxidoreductase [Rhodobiaceae bacterium]